MLMTYQHGDSGSGVLRNIVRQYASVLLPHPLILNLSFGPRHHRLSFIVMEGSSVSPATPVDIPLERSLYIGNIFRGVLLGENSVTNNCAFVA
jgi:hypothetical protein